MNNLAIFESNDYPAKAGMLSADARHLRRTLETIIGMVTDLPNYADDHVLEAIVHVGSEAVETTEYLAYKPSHVQHDRPLSNGKIKTATGFVEDGPDYDARDWPDGIG